MNALGSIVSQRVFRHAHMACGIGAGARGFNQANPRVGNVQAKFECAGGIDVDAGAIRNFEKLTGGKGTVMDLFSLEQYVEFHGKLPPDGWKEAMPEDVYASFGPAIDVAFTSMPCKGFSGLLSEKQSKTDKYQALNGLTLRSVWLLLEAYKNEPIPIILFENVPRIRKRGRALLDKIVQLLRAYGYHVAETEHDCGELGWLAQSRKRYLLIARHAERVPPFVYQPVKHKLRGVGEVIGKLPLPGDPVAGVMHGVPRLQWKTWVRLAFVPAGRDWRALNDLNVEDGVLTDFGIVPEMPLRDGALGVHRWGDSTGVVIGNQRSPLHGRHAVADPRPHQDLYRTSLGVTDWTSEAGVIGGRGFPLNGAYSVADPRPTHGPNAHQNKMRVVSTSSAAPVVTGSDRVGSGALSVADPRPGYRPSTHQNILSVASYSSSTKTVSGAVHVAGGALSVADVRCENGHPRSVMLGVRAWTATAACVKGDVSVGTGPYAVQDPRLHGKPRFNNTFRIVPMGGTSPAVAGPGGPAGGLAVADCRPGPSGYDSRKYKVTPFDVSSRAVIGASTTGDGAFAVADPRPGQSNQSFQQYGVRPWAGHVNAVTAQATPGGGAYAVADPRAGLGVQRAAYQTSGHYGVVAWQGSAGTVSATASHDNGRGNVADPRPVDLDCEPIVLPAPTDRLVCRIISTDDTWHRPFTTLELASLQSLFDPEEVFHFDGELNAWRMVDDFGLEATSDATRREWIGNAVPSAASRAMAHEIGETLLLAALGETFTLSSKEIWVSPFRMAIATDLRQPAIEWDMQ